MNDKKQEVLILFQKVNLCLGFFKRRSLIDAKLRELYNEVNTYMCSSKILARAYMIFLIYYWIL